jgi:hypothetical protein
MRKRNRPRWCRAAPRSLEARSSMARHRGAAPFLHAAPTQQPDTTRQGSATAMLASAAPQLQGAMPSRGLLRSSALLKSLDLSLSHSRSSAAIFPLCAPLGPARLPRCGPRSSVLSSSSSSSSSSAYVSALWLPTGVILNTAVALSCAG